MKVLKLAASLLAGGIAFTAQLGIAQQSDAPQIVPISTILNVTAEAKDAPIQPQLTADQIAQLKDTSRKAVGGFLMERYSQKGTYDVIDATNKPVITGWVKTPSNGLAWLLAPKDAEIAGYYDVFVGSLGSLAKDSSAAMTYIPVISRKSTTEITTTNAIIFDATENGLTKFGGPTDPFYGTTLDSNNTHRGEILARLKKLASPLLKKAIFLGAKQDTYPLEKFFDEDLDSSNVFYVYIDLNLLKKMN